MRFNSPEQSTCTLPLPVDCSERKFISVCAPVGSCYVQWVDWSARTIQVTSGRPGGTTAAELDNLDALRWDYCSRTRLLGRTLGLRT